MAKHILRVSFILGLIFLIPIQVSTSLEPQLTNHESPQKLNLNSDFGRIPLYFIPNEGQVDERALFYAKASRYALWLTKEGLVFDSTRKIMKESADEFTYDRDVSRLIFVNANISPEVVPVDQNEHKVNYLIGNDKLKWRSNIQTSRAVLYRELYPNIDLKVYGIEKQIEYDFVVKPGGKVSDIGFEYKDVEKTKIDKIGNLVVETKFGELEHAKPVCYQVIGGKRIEVKAEFKKIENNIFSFTVEKYNESYELIIDPLVLVYSTYLGGSDYDQSNGIVVDTEGAVYVTGETKSSDFPTQNPIQGIYGGDRDAFITKINASGTALVYSTYVGGSDHDKSTDIAVDTEGAVYVIGETDSSDFPTQNPIQGTNGGDRDAFITKINASGTALVYSTYLGGSDRDGGSHIVVDTEGAVYVTGGTRSFDFPTQNPIQGTNGGDYDAFITKINASGTALVYSTYLGGSDREGGGEVALDSERSVYVTGVTESFDFPTRNPIQGTNAGNTDVFITKVNSAGSALIYSTYLGGVGTDYGGSGIAVDSMGAAYVTGPTESFDFPTKSPIQGSYAGASDVFFTKINSSGSALDFSTYLGGSNSESGSVAVDSEGAVYVTGGTNSVDFPTLNPIQGTNAGDWDSFITKIGPAEKIRIVSWNILNYPDLNGDPREEYYQRVIKVLSPDILIVQEMTSFYGVDEFLKKVLKPISKKYKASNFFDGPDTDNALFYLRSKIKLQSRLQIPTSFRDISEYSLKIKKGPGKGNIFKIYSVHFTEGLNASDKSQRENEANILRAYLNSLPLNSLFLVCGTFNMESSNEGAYKILTEAQIDNIGRLKDPIDESGKWHHRKKFKNLHTESTRKTKYGDGASGGLNDRFDMILISYSLDQNGQLNYMPGSCVAYGNDRKHFNKAINKPKNQVVSLEIADALYEASDHLPVVIDLVPQDESLTKDRLN